MYNLGETIQLMRR